MPKRVSKEELSGVLGVNRDLGGVVSVGEVTGRVEIPRRTLQRHLARLAEAGELEAISERGGRRYRIPEAAQVSPAHGSTA